ncbi:MAG: tetratricopeptide repeat protein [Burkholderiaceae bacterium]
MHLFNQTRSRAALLLVTLSLIGGTGCITASIISAEQQKSAQKAYEDKQKKEFENDQSGAARGDLAAATRLGVKYISGPPYLEKNIPKGVALLEQATEKQYGPAEYVLGWLLVSGKDPYHWGIIAPEQLPRQPARGIELLKRSATRSCVMGPLFENSPASHVANEIGDLYRYGRVIAQDSNQANLWLARSILHCRDQNPFVIQYKFIQTKDPSPQAKIDTLAFLLLMPPNEITTKLQSAMPASDVDSAKQKMKQLRQAVVDSEKQYPAPPDPVKP